MSEESGDDGAADGQSVGDGPDDGRADDGGSSDGRSSDDGSAEGWSFDEPATPVDSETAAGVDDEPSAESSDPERSDVERSDADRSEDGEHEPSVAGVFGARPEDAPPRPEIVPESPDIENALFVLVGVLFGLFVIYRAVVVFGG